MKPYITSEREQRAMQSKVSEKGGHSSRNEREIIIKQRREENKTEIEIEIESENGRLYTFCFLAR